jgi:hypothetical protein
MKLLILCSCLLFCAPGFSKEVTTSSISDPNIIEEVQTDNYAQLQFTDPIPRNLLRWEKDSGKTLFFSKAEPPFVILKGKLKAGYGMSINDKFVAPDPNGTFKLKLTLPLAISTFTVKLFDPQRRFSLYRWLSFWTRVPPSFRMRVQEGDTVVEKNLGFAGRVKRAAFAQLYSDDTPTSLVDLDSQRHAKLSFRMYYPPEPEQLYDGWTFQIRNGRNEVVSEVKRFGTLPLFIDWREVSEGILLRDTYYYQVNLYKESEQYDGIPNRFETIEGLSLLESDYLPTMIVEPRAEVGHFSFRYAGEDPDGSYSGVYAAADASFVLWNRALFRGTALTSLQNANPQHNFTFTRLGIGTRIYGHGENAWLGSPHLARVDLLATLSAFSILPRAYVPRYIDWGILIEPHIVLWSYQYLVPWVEYGVRPERGIRRLSLGVTYYFFIRPWSIKLGLGVASDRLLQYQPSGSPEPEEDKRFSAVRAFSSLIFFL